jgi:hypothetical protein
MAAIYEKQQTKFAGSFASDQAALTIGGDANTPLGIVQNANVSFAQSINRIYDVSNGGMSQGVPVFYVGGRTQGQATIARVLGPESGALCDFYRLMGNVCSPSDIMFRFQGGCESKNRTGSVAGVTETEDVAIAAAVGNAENNKVSYTLQGCVMTNVGIQVGAQDMIVNENVTLMFANLECQGG